jgi:hypothetical protein
MNDRTEPSAFSFVDEHNALDVIVSERGGVRAETVSPCSRSVDGDIIGELAASYFQALEGERDSPIYAYEQPAAQPAHALTDAEEPGAAPDSATDGTISAWLGGSDSLEDVFGHFQDSDEPMAELSALPEILELFAPAGYQATHAERIAPDLARREHHTLAIDSPMQQGFRTALEHERRIQREDE